MLSIVLPTYNEKDSILNTINSIEKILKKNKIKYEIIVTDDNSPDKTWKIVENLSKKNKNIKIIRRFKNKGLSPSVIDGFKEAKGKYLLVMDADGQHDETKIPQMLKKIENNDIVIGSRYTNQGSCGNWNFIRILMSKSASLVTMPLLKGKKVTDPMAGFFMIKNEVFEKINKKLQISGYKILLDILFASPKNIKISEISYTFKTRKAGTSKLGIKVIYEYFEMLFYEYIKQYQTLICFLIVGIIGTIINLGIMFTMVEYFSINEIISSLVAIETSIIHNFILNNFWTFSKRKITKGIGNKFIKFQLTSVIALTINVGTMYVLTKMNVWYLFAQFIGIVFAFIINFLINSKWVFKNEK